MAESRQVSSSLARDLLWCAGAGIASPALGVLCGRWAFPIISTLAFYPLFLSMTRRRGTGSCLAITLLWVLIHSVTSIALAHHDLPRYESSVLGGETYRLEMFTWLETGVGAESDPVRFVPVHFLHLGAFLLLSWLSRSAVGLLLGVVLLNYMNAYVGALTLEGNPYLLGVMGWHPWAVLRVVGFLLAAILLARRGHVGLNNDGVTSRWQGWGVVAALIVADLLLKAALAPWWREWIRSHMMG